MAFAGVNYLAVLVAAVGSFLFGGLWYGLFSDAWMSAAGLNENNVGSAKRRPNALPLIVAFVAQLLMAFVLAGTIGHMGQVTARVGLITAAFVWAGFVVTTLIVNYEFQQKPRLLTLIDAGHWLGVLLIQGAIIGRMGVS